jgi:hypothetical protein
MQSFAPRFDILVAVSVLHLVSPAANGRMTLPTHYILENFPFVIQRAFNPALGRAQADSGGVFQVVKTAQSRERTGRTLLKAPSQ